MYAVNGLNMTVPVGAIYGFIGENGSVSTDSETGVETVMRGPENTWQNIGTLPGGAARNLILKKTSLV